MLNPVTAKFTSQLQRLLPAAAFPELGDKYLTEPRGHYQGSAGLLVAPGQHRAGGAGYCGGGGGSDRRCAVRGWHWSCWGASPASIQDVHPSPADLKPWAHAPDSSLLS
jgi:hypothetical protein